jgi:phage tail sheath gpL-like
MAVTSLPKGTAQLLAARGLAAPEQFVLCITGVISGSGTATSKAVYDGVENMTKAEIQGLFGTSGELTNRIFRAREICQGYFPIYVIAITQAAGTNAFADLAFTGSTAATAATVTLKLIDAEWYTTTFDIAAAGTPNAAAVACKAAIDALIVAKPEFPATTAIDTDKVTLTAVDDGTIANKWTIEITGLPSGIAVTGSPRIQFASGATDPTLTAYFDNAVTQRFHAISWPWTTATVVSDFLEDRNVIDNAFLHGVAFVGFDGTQAAITALVNGATPLNSPNLIYVGNRQVVTTSVTITPPDFRAVELASIIALRQTDDAPIAQYVTVDNERDIIGNAGLASLAMYNTPLPNTHVVVPSLLFTGDEQDDVKDDGFTIIGVNESSTSMIAGEVVTTYKFNSRGEDDVSFKYYNYVLTGYTALEVIYNTLKSDYSQFRLTSGDLVSGRAITNADQIKGNISSVYKRLAGSDYTLLVAGKDAESYFFKNLSVTADIATGAVTIYGKLPIVTQFRSFNMAFQMSFSINS